MSHNEDYLNRRHERREAARKKREAEAKRVKRTPLIPSGKAIRSE